MYSDKIMRQYSEKSIYEINSVRNKLYRQKGMGTTESQGTTIENGRYNAKNIEVQQKSFTHTI
jgi:hypothetical protein